MKKIKRASFALIGLSIMGLAIVGLASCEDKSLLAPDDANGCYYIGYPNAGVPKFNLIKKNVKSVEYCAAELDQLRMLSNLRPGKGRDTIDGAYNGNFIFIEGRYIRMSQTYNGSRFPLLVRTNDGRLVVPGSIVEDAPVDNSVISEPNNLPQ